MLPKDAWLLILKFAISRGAELGPTDRSMVDHGSKLILNLKQLTIYSRWGALWTRITLLLSPFRIIT